MQPDIDVEAALRIERVGRLATADKDGRPHVVPIVFAYANQSIYTPLDRKAKAVAPARMRRVRNILANPEVQVLLDHYEEDWGRLWWIQVRGTAELLEDGQEYQAGCELLKEKYPQYRELPLDGRPIIRVKITRIVSWGRPGALGRS